MYKTHSEAFYISLIEFLMVAKQQVTTVGAEHELTSIQTITLLLLSDDSPQPMKNLCRLYHCDASNITGIIDGLENKGLVSRQNDSADRRIKVLVLEPLGRQLRAIIAEKLGGMDETLLAPLDTHERHELMRLILKITAHNSQLIR